jgi:hypothetical protein
MPMSLNDAFAGFWAMAVNDPPVADLNTVRKDGRDTMVDFQAAVMVSRDDGSFHVKPVQELTKLAHAIGLQAVLK